MYLCNYRHDLLLNLLTVKVRPFKRLMLNNHSTNELNSYPTLLLKPTWYLPVTTVEINEKF